LSKSRIHHFVPQFLLRRFSGDAEAENPRLCHLDKATGRCSVRSVRGEAAVAGYNDLLEMQDIPKEYAEHTLGLVEDQAASVVSSLVDGRLINPAERMAMAMFLYFQYHRGATVVHVRQLRFRNFLGTEQRQVIPGSTQKRDTLRLRARARALRGPAGR
jgi:Protein of unknown function (DUF4238)